VAPPAAAADSPDRSARRPKADKPDASEPTAPPRKWVAAKPKPPKRPPIGPVPTDFLPGPPSPTIHVQGPDSAVGEVHVNAVLMNGDLSLVPADDPDPGFQSRESSTRHHDDMALDGDMRILDLAPPITIDAGTSTVKAGLAHLPAPSCVFATMVGRPKKQRAILEAGPTTETYIGDAAQQRRGVLAMTWPMECGRVTNWEDMALVWDHLFTHELRLNPEDHPLLLTDAPLGDPRHRQLMAEVLFETFQVPALYIADTGCLSVLAAGHVTGLAVSSGQGATHAVPVYEGHTLLPAVRPLPVAGKDLTEHMARLLRDSQLPCNVSGLDITALKAIVCYVAEAFDTEMRKPREEVGLEYTLPDGNVVEIGDARFRCPEALFQPGLLGVPHGGLPSTVIEAVECCDPDLRGQLYSHLVLSGGNTLYPGLERRLAADLTDRVSGVNVAVEAHPERLYFPWVGGAIAATSAAMATRWIVEDEYREFGPNIVPRKCM
jgi:actin